MNKPAKGAVLTLPKVMDLKAARHLATDLLAARGKPVMLDASHVQRVGGLSLQVLLSARAHDRAAIDAIHLDIKDVEGL